MTPPHRFFRMKHAHGVVRLQLRTVQMTDSVCTFKVKTEFLGGTLRGLFAILPNDGGLAAEREQCGG